DGKLMETPQVGRQAGICTDEPFDVLSMVDSAGVHHECAIEREAGSDCRLLIRSDPHRPELLIGRRGDAGDSIVLDAEVLDPLPTGRVGDGQKEIRASEILQLVRIPGSDHWMRQVRLLMDEGNQVVQHGRRGTPPCNPVDAGDRVVIHSLAHAAHETDIRMETGQESLAQRLRRATGPVVLAGAMGGAPDRSPDTHVARFDEATKVLPNGFDAFGKRAIQCEQDLVGPLVAKNPLCQSEAITADAAISRRAGLRALQVDDNTHQSDLLRLSMVDWRSAWMRRAREVIDRSSTGTGSGPSDVGLCPPGPATPRKRRCRFRSAW